PPQGSHHNADSGHSSSLPLVHHCLKPPNYNLYGELLLLLLTPTLDLLVGASSHTRTLLRPVNFPRESPDRIGHWRFVPACFLSHRPSIFHISGPAVPRHLLSYRKLSRPPQLSRMANISQLVRSSIPRCLRVHRPA